MIHSGQILFRKTKVGTMANGELLAELYNLILNHHTRESEREKGLFPFY